jgi:hypothetical protein
VGRLVKRLKDSGQWTRSLLVITADHGESFAVKRTPAEPFKPGHLHWRRAVTPANLEEIAPVPLFVKYPDQQEGASDQRFVRTLDVLPTIADVTEHPARWGLAGRSLRDDAYTGNATVSVGTSEGGAVSLPAQGWLARAAAAQHRVLSVFPAGQGLASLYGIGPRPDLNGRALSELRVLPRGRVRATLTEPDRWRSVHLHSWLLPLHVTGAIFGKKPNGRRLAIAVNGRIAATAWSFRPLGAKRLSISALIPEAALRSGRNDVRVYEIVGQASLRRLG